MRLSLGSTPVRAVLQAGGLGTRMRPASADLPKHLLPVAGVPMVERLLRQLAAANIKQVWMIVGHLGHLVEEHFTHLANPPDLDLNFIHETTRRGDIGSLAEVPVEAGPLLWCYGDLVTDLDFARLIDVHHERGCPITLTSHYEDHQVRLGELVAHGDRVLHYLEKPVKRFLICSGIAVFEPEILPLVDRDNPFGLDELVERAIGEGHDVTHWLHGAFWMDVNDPELLAQAETALAET